MYNYPLAKPFIAHFVTRSKKCPNFTKQKRPSNKDQKQWVEYITAVTVTTALNCFLIGSVWLGATASDWQRQVSINDPYRHRKQS